MNKILFIDRDGTLVEEPADFQVDALNKIRLAKDVIPALLSLVEVGYQLVLISNQDGLGTDSFPSEQFHLCQDFIAELFNSQGLVFSQSLFCPHREADNCTCRKPKTGLLDDFMRQQDIDKENSWVIGDRDSDRLLANNLGVSFLPISKDFGWKAVAHTILSLPRTFQTQRITKETAISLLVNLDAMANTTIDTPIGFFSHMLEQVARHGGFSLELKATGDMVVDDHHLIEDTAIALGDALRQALGDKTGIGRYGFMLPMDESLASVAIDICGRGHCTFEAEFTRELVGGLATEMIPHFFKSFAHSLGASLHIRVSGENHHHMIEACFKGLGQVLKQALLKRDKMLPSTKGVL